MIYLHTMIRVTDIDESLVFFCDGLGLRESHRTVSKEGRFTLVFLATPEDMARHEKIIAAGIPNELPCIELTHNWDPEEYTSGRNFGHLAYATDDIFALCDHLQEMGIDVLRPPRDGRMAFVRSPDGISVELLQKGAPLEPREPWRSMENKGAW